MDFAIQAACSFLPSPIAPHVASFLRSFQNDSGESHGPVLDFLKAQTPLIVSLVGLYFAATSMLRTLRVAYRSSIFFAKWGSLAAVIGVVYQACNSSDPVKSVQSSLSTLVHSASALSGLGGSALYWLSMFIGGETGENVRKAAAWLFPNDQAAQKAKKRRASETTGSGPAYGTRSRKTKKNAVAANPLTGLWNSATGAADGEPDDAGADAVSDFIGRIVGAAGGDAVEQLKGMLNNGGNLQDVLDALAGAVGGQNGNGARR